MNFGQASNDNLCEGTRAQVTFEFWEASRAWYNVGQAAEGWTIEDILCRLKSLTYIMGPVAQQAQELLDRVIEDQYRRRLQHSGEVVRLHPSEIQGRRAEFLIIDEYGSIEAHHLEVLKALESK